MRPLALLQGARTPNHNCKNERERERERDRETERDGGEKRSEMKRGGDRTRNIDNMTLPYSTSSPYN